LSVEAAKMVAQAGQDTFFRIENCPKPIIACVNGFALGGGCELAMSCHFRIASETAKFGQPEVNLGLIPGYGGTQRLTQLIGKGRAMEHILSAKLMDAATALQYGLVNYVVASDALLPKAMEILTLITSKAPLAVAASIGAVNAVFDETRDGYAAEIDGFAFCFGTEDAAEGINAFIQKRSPVFVGK
jgi:enoyl-CoA hydratase